MPDHPNLTAVLLNCTLKRSPAESNTGALMDVVTGHFDTLGVAHETVRVVDYHIPFGVTSDEGTVDGKPDQ